MRGFAAISCVTQRSRARIAFQLIGIAEISAEKTKGGTRNASPRSVLEDLSTHPSTNGILDSSAMSAY
jgi:hypothetical protein